jgi:hypothetical protein
MTRAVLLVLAIAVTTAIPAGASTEALVPLVQPGPWSGVSALIGYGARLWFVNSVKFVDHNSAAVYSYDPRRGTARYEAHLFSQDAGEPTVAHGLLYWPFEDPRFSTGRGEYAVTDGQRWQWRILADGEVFHVHAMTSYRGALYAATSAWRAGLQRSDDGGRTWRVVYDHPGEARTVTRITALATSADVLYAGLTATDEHGVKLLRWDGGTLRPVAAWPMGVRVDVLASYRDRLYGVTVDASGDALWRTDGHAAERVGGLGAGRIRALAAAPDTLWAVTATDGAGTLWRSPDGVTWTTAQRFDDAEPLALAVYAGNVYVGTRGPNGRGTLWGPRPPSRVEPVLLGGQLPPSPGPGRDPLTGLAALDRALAARASYLAHRGRLRDALQPLALGRDRAVGAELSRRLDRPVPDLDVPLFGGALVVPAAKLARWYLLWAIALNGHGRIPVELLASPWSAKANRPEKYLESPAAAAWAVARIGQSDAATVGALVARLGSRADPGWLDGDLVGALAVLTGERFGYDVAGWRRWWSRRQTSGR